MFSFKRLWNSLFSPRSAYGPVGGGSVWRTVFGTRYSADVSDKSKLCISTFWACVRNKAEDIASLPFKVLQTVPRGELSYRKSIPWKFINKLFTQQFNPYVTAYQGRKTLGLHVEGWGNGLAFKEMNSEGDVVELWIIHPSRVVRMWQNYDREGVTYEIRNNDGGTTEISSARMFHVFNDSPNGLWGYSRVDLMRKALGFATVAQDFAINFYKNGARPSGILKSEESLSKESRDELKKQWFEAYGGTENSGKTAVIDAGLEYLEIKGMSLKDQNFLELMQFSDEQIARHFRMPLYKLQIVKNAQGWSTLDAQEADYATSCLMPTTTGLEQQIRMQLMGIEMDDDSIWPHHEYKGRLLGDVTTRMKFGAYLVNIGYPPNLVISAIEDLPPVPNEAMDKSYMPSNMLPIEKLGVAPEGSAVQSAPTSPRGKLLDAIKLELNGTSHS